MILNPGWGWNIFGNNFEMGTGQGTVAVINNANNTSLPYVWFTGNVVTDFTAGYAGTVFTLNTGGGTYNFESNFMEGRVATTTMNLISGSSTGTGLNQLSVSMEANALCCMGTFINVTGGNTFLDLGLNTYGATITTFLTGTLPVGGRVFDNTGLWTFYSPSKIYGQADIVASSGAINTTETVIVKTPAFAASRVVAGTHFRVILDGTCTATVANTSTFTLRWGTNGTTADGTVAAFTTSASATTGTNNGFRTVIDLTVRTAGAAATSQGMLQLTSDGNIGIVATPNVKSVAGTAFNTTTANAILSLAYKSAATTTTSTFTNATIEVVQQ